MKLILRAFGWLFLWIIILTVVFFAVIWYKSYNPPMVESLSVVGQTERLDKDTIKIVSWNIGYAGLGEDMDFFYDGGRSVQSSYGQTAENLRAITSFLKEHSDADFILLQEVDLNSKRSYQTNQYDTILKALGSDFTGFVGLNYVSPYVPIPLYNPIGSVRAGVVTFTRHTPRSAVRYAYPGGFSWPTSMFNLKRCLLSIELPISDSSTLTIGNTHNTAYDQGGMRQGELEFLKAAFVKAPYFVIAGDWNSNPPGYTAGNAEIMDPYFSPMAISNSMFDKEWTFAYDPKTKSSRYGYQPYDSTSTTRTIIDFALAGPRVEPISAQCIDLGFENSDHNPVIMKFKIRR